MFDAGKTRMIGRIRADLTMCFKIVHQVCRKYYYSGTPSQTIRLYPDARVNARAHAFPVRIVFLWNRLPANIVLPANLKQFKMAIKTLTFRMHLLVKIEF